MANEENLIPIQEVNSRRTREQHSRDSKKGGLRSAEVKRERRTMAETLKILLDMPLSEQQVNQLAKTPNFASLKGQNVTVKQAICIAQIQKAIKGDKNAVQFVRDTIGEQPVQQVEVNGNGLPVKIVDDVPTDDEILTEEMRNND